MLRSVLGRRTGLEKSVVINFDDKRKKVTEKSPSDDIGVPAEMIEDEKNIGKYQKELKFLEKSINGFNIKYFTEGAIKAYEMTLISHSEENYDTLNSLLEKDLYDDFVRSIDVRNENSQKLEYSLIKVSELHIEDIKIDNKTVSIVCTIKADINSSLSEFQEDEKITKRNSSKTKEVWTFRKNLKTKDPNWKVQTISRLN
tara:strand:- start:4012 stop:4611 length:600 start_codon:yes stop_codon:yes gene_type:complete